VAGQLGHGGLGQGADVTTITLSSNQHAACCRRADAAGVGDLVDVRLLDYRDVRGQYDAVVSVEMFEAVSREHWPAYFGALRRLTAPGGRIRLQAITMPHDRMLAAASTRGRRGRKGNRGWELRNRLTRSAARMHAGHLDPMVADFEALPSRIGQPILAAWNVKEDLMDLLAPHGTGADRTTISHLLTRFYSALEGTSARTPAAATVNRAVYEPASAHNFEEPA
jgi:mycolic acid cyclopropane synthetase